MKCDSCPNETDDFDQHNEEFYELHVYNSHPAEDAQRIIEEHYARFPGKRWRPGYKVIKREKP